MVGAVLTGGASRRMGSLGPKALLAVDGVPMAVRVADALRAAGAADVVCVGLAVPGEGSVPDLHPGEGPLGGILTALAWAPSDATVVVAPCDLLAPDAAAFGRLAAAADPLAVPALDRPLPLAARPAARPGMEAAFADGERSLRAVVTGAAVVALPAAVLADADTPDSLPGRERAKRAHGG